MNRLIDEYKGFIFDMDGTIILENKMLGGAVNTINALIEKGKHILFVTNKTIQSNLEYVNFLNQNGITISSNQIITTTTNCINYMMSELANKKFYAIAEDTFINTMIESGFVFTENPDEIEILIVTLDRNYSRSKFNIAKKALDNGAEFLAANIDDTCPVIEGEIVDAGIIISELEKETGKKLSLHFGKPSQFMITAIKDKLIHDEKDYLILGDRLETDISIGNKMGMDTALVKSRVNNKTRNSTYNITYTVTSIKEILSR